MSLLSEGQPQPQDALLQDLRAALIFVELSEEADDMSQDILGIALERIQASVGLGPEV